MTTIQKDLNNTVFCAAKYLGGVWDLIDGGAV